MKLKIIQIGKKYLIVQTDDLGNVVEELEESEDIEYLCSEIVKIVNRMELDYELPEIHIYS